MAMAKIVMKLSERLRPVSETQVVEAAVALLLRPVNDTFSLLFVRRVNRHGDPWSGQMALPGGKREPNDKDLKQTVIRETLEEININLAHCRFLGTTRIEHSATRPKIGIVPFVILVEHEPVIRLNEKELEAYNWILLKELIEHRGTVKFSFGEFPAYLVDGRVIWGVTYRIVEDLLHKIG